jgi:hypothetical protein
MTDATEPSRAGRKIAAYGASRGSLVKEQQSPEGATDTAAVRREHKPQRRVPGDWV